MSRPAPRARTAAVTEAEPMTEAQARQHVEKLKEFYWHLLSFLMVMPMLAVINLTTSPGHVWFIYPLFGWGLGLIGHAAEVFGMPGFGSKWEQRKMQELMGVRRDDSEASAERLRALVSEAVGEEEARQRRAQDVSTERLLRRIEHLEAIVTSRDWDLLEADYRQPADAPKTTPPAPRLDLDSLPRSSGALPDEAPGIEKPPATSEERAAYLARRVH